MLGLERSSYHRRYISVLGRHIDKHELKCTCVGGDSNVPWLGRMFILWIRKKGTISAHRPEKIIVVIGGSYLIARQ